MSKTKSTELAYQIYSSVNFSITFRIMDLIASPSGKQVQGLLCQLSEAVDWYILVLRMLECTVI